MHLLAKHALYYYELSDCVPTITHGQVLTPSLLLPVSKECRVVSKIFIRVHVYRRTTKCVQSQ